MDGFVHRVEMRVTAEEAPERLRRIDSWCGDWQIGFCVLDRLPGSETILLAFEDRSLARAFVGHFGGVLVDERELEDAFAAHETFEDAYDRLAREFNR